MNILRLFNRHVGDKLNISLISHANLYPWQHRPIYKASSTRTGLPPGALEYLRSDNPRLQELQRRYENFDPTVTTPLVWTRQKLADEDLRFFRGDNPYVWQLRGLNFNELSYALTYYALLGSPCGRVLERLDEDDLFGVHTFHVDGRMISRDLLDSAREIAFLEQNGLLAGPSVNILDIGAGYGRLAHRLSQATEAGVKVYATDAYASSTFLSEYYLKLRCPDRATVVPLDEIEDVLSKTSFDLAINIHSFSECTVAAISWWVERLAAHRVRYLMIIPNGVSDGTLRCRTNDGQDMEEIFRRYGYRCVLSEPRFRDPVIQKYGVDPAQLSLFELA